MGTKDKWPSATSPENEDEKVFAQFSLSSKDEFPHPHGRIPTKYMGRTPDGMNDDMIWGLRKGISYPPETHSHGHILTIKHGFGVVSINGEEKNYTSGDVFDIGGNVPHGFVRVDETTIVVQRQPVHRFIKPI